MPITLTKHLEHKLMKNCRVCKQIKQLKDYYNAKLGADSKRGECKECADIYSNSGIYPIVPNPR